MDSNIYCKDYSLSGTTFQALLTDFHIRGDSLFVPRIVLEEVVNKYYEEYHQLFRTATRIGFVNYIHLPNSNEERERYLTYFQEKLSAFHYSLLDYPTISHEDLAKKALEYKKPFKQDGQGYRDSLIWATVLDLAGRESTESIGFISANTNDFTDRVNNRQLHPDLREDLERRFAGRCVFEIGYYPSLETYVQEHIYSTLEILTDIETRLDNNSYEGLDLKRFIEDNVNEFALGKEFSSAEIGLPDELSSVNLSWIDDVLNIEDISVRKLSETDIMISFFAEVVCNFDFYANRYYVLYNLDDVNPRSDVTDERDDFIRASVTRQVVLIIELIFNVTSRQVTSKQVISVHPSDVEE
ncbi:MAG: PIN domain-containing protein [Candidatus Aminicenantes bacterium]|nr:PIN domain-containing protein [Candidatus Aminicenantes bacterium]